MKLTEMKISDVMTSWSIQYFDVESQQWCQYLFLGTYTYCNRADTLQKALEQLNLNRIDHKLFEHTVKRMV